MRTIGTVEALLVLSEWPPRSMLMEDTAFSPPETYATSACKHQDNVAWTNVALAVRIAQEVGLHDETTYAPEDTASWETRRRLNVWIREYAWIVCCVTLTFRVHECRSTVSRWLTFSLIAASRGDWDETP